MKRQLVLFIAIISITVFNCAYFNIFYNANKYYNLGIAPIKDNKSPNTAYLDKAIEKSSKILEFHPQSQYVDDALIIIGKAYMYKGEYTKAIRKFNELQTYYEKSEYIDESVFYTAKTYILQGETQIAEVYLRQLIEADNKWQPDAVFELSDIYKEEQKFTNAIDILRKYENIIDDRNTLFFKEAMLYYAADSLDASFEALEEVRMNRLPNQYRFDYVILNALLLSSRNDYEKAYDMINRNIKFFTVNEQKNSLLLMKARILKALNRADEAVTLIDDILVQGRSIPLKDSLLFEKAVILEQYEKEMDRAKDTYQVIVDEVKQSPLLPEAQMKIMSIELMQSLQSDSITDEEKIAKNRFLLAEINYLSLERMEEALKLYSVVADSYPLSYYAPKSLFALSYIKLNEYNDTVAAETYLNKLTENYPDADIYLEAEKLLIRIHNAGKSEE